MAPAAPLRKPAGSGMMPPLDMIESTISAAGRIPRP
jgi:hypothetical protein